MLANAFRELRLHPGRFAAVITAIALSIGFLTAVQVFVATEGDATGKREVIQTTNADIAVSGSFGDLDAVEAQLRATPGLVNFERVSMYMAPATAHGRNALLKLYSTPTTPSLQWAKVESGTMPANETEIALPVKTAGQLQLKVGDSLRIGEGGEAPTYKVTALVDEPGLFLLPAYTTTEGVARAAGEDAKPTIEWIGDVEKGTDPQAVADDLRPRIQSLKAEDAKADPKVDSARVARDEAVKALANDFDAMQNMLLVFGAIALLVGSIIISNTFNILVAQRRRQTGLLRAVGASRGQVFRRFLAEAFALGLVGSLIGVAVGIGLAAIPSSDLLTGSLRFGLSLPWVRLALTVVLGIVVTMLASLVPLRKALQVAPLEALRPVESAEDTRRGNAIRGTITGLLVAAGLALCFWSLTLSDNNILVAIAGSILFTLGVLGAAPLYVPVLLRGLGKVVGFNPTARLAAVNSARNPGRAGATATALMLAVGLIVTLGVGAATIKETMNKELDESYPIALTVSSSFTFDRQTYQPKANPPLPEALVAKVADVEGIDKAVGARGTQAVTMTFTAKDGKKTASGMNPIVAYSAALDEVMPDRVTPSDDEVLVHPDMLTDLGLADGDRVDVTIAPLSFGGRGMPTEEPTAAPVEPVVRSMVVKGSKLASEANFVTERTLKEIAPDAGLTLIVASVPDRTNAAQINADVRKLVQEEAPGSQVGGSLFLKAMIGQVLDYMLMVTSGLLGVAALIALIGVGNTLSLSVMERTRESALLRALGLQARSLRWMLLIEALLLAAVATVVGIAAGSFFGWLGASAIMKQMDLQGSALFRMNVPQLVVVVVVAALAAVIASILPGRKAAKATPVEALADVG